MFRSLKNGWQFIKSSLAFLTTNKDLLVFPLLSLVAMLIAIGIAGSFIVFDLSQSGPMQQTLIEANIGLFVMLYFILSFIIFYFHAALITCATLRLQGQKASVKDGLKTAAKSWHTLLAWSVISATVGALLNSIEKSHRTIGDTVGFILGASWSVMSFFVVPILVFEKKGPWAALKRSLDCFKRGWRKLFSISAIVFMVFAALFGLLFLLGNLIHDAFPAEDTALMETGAVLFGLFLLCLMTVGRVFNGIVISALYLKVLNHKEVQGFDTTLLENAFAPRRQIIE